MLHNAQNAQNEMTFEDTLVDKHNRVDISFWTNRDLALIGSSMPQRFAKVAKKTDSLDKFDELTLFLDKD